MTAILAYATQLLGLVPSIMTMTQGIRDLFTQGNAALAAMQKENRAPNDAEWAALDALRDAVHAAIQK